MPEQQNEFEIDKTNQGYKVSRRIPKENKIGVQMVKSLEEYEKLLGEDEMGLASFNAARRKAAEAKASAKEAPVKEEPKPKSKPKAKK